VRTEERRILAEGAVPSEVLEMILEDELVIFFKIESALRREGKLNLKMAKILDDDFRGYYEKVGQAFHEMGGEFSLRSFFEKSRTDPNRWMKFRIRCIEASKRKVSQRIGQKRNRTTLQ
jgi:hypothetical protein